MKVSELFEAEFINTVLDREIQRQHNAGKKGMDQGARDKRTAARGFRVGFAKDSWDGAEGLNDADMKIFNAAKKAGEKAKKGHKGEIPPIQLKNGYGERRPNPAFNKVIKPYLDAFHGAVKEDLNEGVVKGEVIGLTKPEVTKYMKKQGFSKFKVPGGEAEYEASYRSDSGFGFWMVEFNDGKAFKIKKSG